MQTIHQQDLLNDLSKTKDIIADSVPCQDFLAVKSKLDEFLEQIDKANKKEGVAAGVEGILLPRPDWKGLFSETPRPSGPGRERLQPGCHRGPS